MKYSNLRKLISANLFTQLTGFLIFLAVAKFFPTEVYGKIALSIFVIGSLIQLIDLGSSVGVVKFSVDKTRNSLNYSNTRSILTLKYIMMLFSIIALFTLHHVFDTQLIVPVVAIFFGVLFIHLQYVLQANQDFHLVSRSLIWSAIARLTLVGICFKVAPSYHFLLACLTLYVVFGIIYIFVKGPVYLTCLMPKIPVSFSFYREYFQFMKWVIGSSMCVVAYQRLDLYAVASLFDEKDIAMYAFAVQLTVIFSTINNSIQTTFLPSMVKDHNSFKDMCNVWKSVIPLIILFYGSIFLISPLFFNYFSEGKYAESLDIFRVLCAGFMFSTLTVPFGNMFYVHGKPGLLTLINFSQLIILILLINVIYLFEWDLIFLAFTNLTIRVLSAATVLFYGYTNFE